jgi:hypothetical protein
VKSDISCYMHVVTYIHVCVSPIFTYADVSEIFERCVGILFVHLVYFMTIWYILWPFGIFYGDLVYLLPILVCCTNRIWQPCLGMKLPTKNVIINIWVC